jgi:ankyrin repeat protein
MRSRVEPLASNSADPRMHLKALLLTAIFFAACLSRAAAEPIDDFTKAIEEGDLAAMERLIADGVDLNARDATGWTPLCKAAATDQFRAINLLVKHKADIDKPTGSGNTPLMFAAGRGNMKAVLVLLAQGADVTKTNSYGRTAREEAVARRHLDVAGFIAFMEADARRPEPKAN